MQINSALFCCLHNTRRTSATSQTLGGWLKQLKYEHMTFIWGVEAENSLIMVSDWSVPFAELNSIRGTKTCFVQHWHQRKAGRSRPTMAFLFLQDSWCLQQNVKCHQFLACVSLTNASLRAPHPRDSFKEFIYFTKALWAFRWGHTIVQGTTQSSSTKTWWSREQPALTASNSGCEIPPISVCHSSLWGEQVPTLG